MESRVERLVFRNCRECNRVMAGDNYYYEFLSQNGKIFYIMQDPQDKLYELSEKEYNDAVGINNKPSVVVKSKKSSKLKNLLLPIILTGMVSTTLSGCKITDQDISNICTYNFSDDNDLTNESKFYINGYYSSFLVRINDERLKDNLRLIPNNDQTFLYDYYAVKNYDKDNSSGVLKKMFNLFDHPNSFYLDEFPSVDIDYEEEYKIISSLNVDIKVKLIILDAVNKINAMGNSKLSYILYNNIRNMSITSNSKEYSEYDYYNHIFNISDRKKAPDYELEKYKLTKEEQRIMDNIYNYVIPYNIGYMATHFYDNGYEYSPERIVLSVDRENEKVVDIDTKGKCLSDGLSDYIQYDITGIKCNRIVGSSINECFYIAFLKMLNITDYDELTSLNVETFTEKFSELGIVNPARYIYTLDYQNNNPFYDYTPLFVELLKDYVNAELSNGKTRQEIIEVVNDIINTIGSRVLITKENDREIILDAFTREGLSIGDIKSYIKELSQIKVKTK